MVLAGSRRASGIGSDTIKFQVTQAMVPGCRILVQYIRPENGEIVADSTFIDVEEKLKNQVRCKLEFRINSLTGHFVTQTDKPVFFHTPMRRVLFCQIFHLDSLTLLSKPSLDIFSPHMPLRLAE